MRRTQFWMSLAASVLVALMVGTVAVAYELRDVRSVDVDPAPYEHVAVPLRLTIPALGIHARVQSVGKTQSGAMASPSNFYEVAWYRNGPRPGEQGSAVITGHVDNALGLSGVFKNLDKLAIGDMVSVHAASGEDTHFRVVRIKIYPYDHVPGDEVFGAEDGSYLNLITCAGRWLRHEQTYDRRLVVYTERI